MPIALIALAFGAFGIGLTEFAILGLLPEVADGLGVSESAAGWLVSGYAITVAIGAIAVTLLVTRFDRKHVLLGLLALFVVGNLICAVAPSYPVMLVGRVVAALCHGAFFGIGSIVATGLVSAERRSRALAVMLTGLTTANVVGVPLGTLLGQQLGWRATFWAIALVGLVASATVAVLVPHIAGEPQSRDEVRRALRTVAGRPVLASLLLTTLAFTAIFAAFTYIALTLTEVSGFDASAIPWILVGFGVGQFAGTLVGGRGADRSVETALLVGFVGLTALLAVFSATASIQALAPLWVVLLGAVGFGMVPALQVRTIGRAGDAATLASGAAISAINVGIALGAWIGGLTISAGGGYRAPVIAGAIVSAVGLAAFAAATIRARATDRPAGAPIDA